MSTGEPGGWGPPPGDPWAPVPPPPPPAPPPPAAGPFPPPPAYGPYGYGSSAPPPPTGGNARTGPLPLQPMGVGEILDGAVKLYRANFKAIALVALAVMGPLQVLSALALRSQLGGRGLLDAINDPSVGQQPADSPFGGLGPQLLLIAGSLLTYLVGPVVAGAVAKAVATSYLGGELTAGQALRASVRRAWPLIAGSVLVHLTEGVGLVGCCIGAAFVMPLWVAVSPAIVVEELGPIRGMKRSWQLCTSRYWPVLGVALLSGVITSVLGQIVSTVFNLPAALVGYGIGFPLVAIGGTLTAIVVTPISAIVATLVYFDLRIRREGFDLQVMADDLARADG